MSVGMVEAAGAEKWRKRLQDLISICESTTWARCPQTASQKIVDALAKVLDCDSVHFHILAVTGQQFTACAGEGLPARPLPLEVPLSATTGRISQLMTTHRPIIMDFVDPHPDDEIPKGVAQIGLRTGVSVPMLVGDHLIGIYTIVYKRKAQWTGEDLDYLLDIGRVLGVAVQHALTARQAADLEILMERKQLSAELHDNLAQLIGSLILGAEAALLSLEEGNPARVRHDIERIRLAGQEADRVLREEMLSLRTPLNETEGLIPEVRECLQRFERQWGIGTDLQVEDSPEGLTVSAQTGLQFMRILHESLSNVLRHATASHVNVVLRWDHHRLSMLIHDNGRGFDPNSVPAEHLGLRIMRERAESLGGELIIESSSESGTSVRVDVPRFAS